MSKPQTTTMRTEIPVNLMTQAQQLVDGGWFCSLDELCTLALRRFLESHREDLMETYIRQDVKWGLRGDE